MKQTCKNCRFNCEEDYSSMTDCDVGSYYAEKGLNRICYLGELWEPKQPQVDFEKVIDTWNTIKFIAEEAVDFEGSEAYFDNMDLFFHLLSTKPTFAKIAHENLKLLNS